MKIIYLLLLVFLVATAECGKARRKGHAELRKLCEENEACIENGHACFRALRTVYIKERDRNPNLQDEMKEKANACLEENNLMSQFEEFSVGKSYKSRILDEEDMEMMGETLNMEESPDDMKSGHQHHHHGHTKPGSDNKMKLVVFMKMLEETAPDSASALRCCIMNNLQIVNDGVLDKDALKDKFMGALTEESQMEQRDAFIGAVDTCRQPENCMVKDYTKCLVEACIRME